MKEIQFCDCDANNIKTNIIKAYEQIAGRTLAQADPVRLFLEAMAAIIIQQREIIDHSAKMNLLHYSTGDYLDHIGYLVGCIRREAAHASTTMEITLSAPIARPVTIPKGTRIGNEGGSIVFATDDSVTILAGNTTATVSATAVHEGADSNNYLPGEIKAIIDRVAYVSSMVNTTTTEGGADRENDEDYRARIRLAPESFSTAGPSGAYEYWVKTASTLITDVAVVSPVPGEVNIYPLLEGGNLPGTELIKKIEKVLSDDVRPLTDKVLVLPPETVTYDIDVSYYIDEANQASENTINEAVQQAVNDYILWQKAKLGRDINPSQLIHSMMQAGAKRVIVTSPEFAEINDNTVAISDNVVITYGGLEDG